MGWKATSLRIRALLSNLDKPSVSLSSLIRSHPSIHLFTNIAGISEFLKMKIINEGSFPSWRQGVYGVGVKGRLSPARAHLRACVSLQGRQASVFCNYSVTPASSPLALRTPNSLKIRWDFLLIEAEPLSLFSDEKGKCRKLGY